jgi:hypothetical protein
LAASVLSALGAGPARERLCDRRRYARAAGGEPGALRRTLGPAARAMGGPGRRLPPTGLAVQRMRLAVVYPQVFSGRGIDQFYIFLR